MTDEDDKRERTTLPNGLDEPTPVPRELLLAHVIAKHAVELEEAQRRELEAYRERDKWRERFMILRSRLHGIRDSLMKLDSELGRIIDEK